MKNLFFILFFGMLSISSCSLDYITPVIIAESGTRVYETDFDHLWDAIKGILLTDGYEIAYENREKGIINTKKKFIRNWTDEDYSKNDYRQYLATVRKIRNDQFEVVLKPRKFHESYNESAKKAWKLEGKYGEIKRWEVLFNRIEALL